MRSTDKQGLIEALARALEHELSAATAAQQNTQAGATHEESRAEGDKDMRATETAYLARGQAARVAELATGLAAVTALTARALQPDDPVALGALVQLAELDEDGEPGAGREYFIAPAGGGLELSAAGERVRVLTPASPLGRALIGRRPGDVVELESPQGLREYELLAVG